MPKAKDLPDQATARLQENRQTSLGQDGQGTTVAMEKSHGESREVQHMSIGPFRLRACLGPPGLHVGVSMHETSEFSGYTCMW